MRKFSLAVALLAIFGMLAPPALAQAPPAPAPKVTITGLFDFIATWYGNLENADLSDAGHKDQGFWTRQRFVPTITGEVGKVKAVWAAEIDLLNGSNAPSTTGVGATTNSFDLDTDVSNNRTPNAGLIETKWLYLEVPVTGAGGILPFVPFASTGKLGGFGAGTVHNYKGGSILGGDIPGIEVATTWAPNIKSTITYVQIGEGDGCANNVLGLCGNAPGGGIAVNNAAVGHATEDWAWLISIDTELIKGLKIKPTYAYAQWDRGTSGGDGGNEAKDGFTPQNNTSWMWRHYFGLDARWTAGPFYIEPSVWWELGKFRRTPDFVQAGAISGSRRVSSSSLANKISAYLFDVTGGFRTGPLNIEGRGTWSPGMEAQHKVLNGSDINYFQPIWSGSGFWGGWTDLWSPGNDGNTSVLAGIPGLNRQKGPSYDKYGLRAFSVAVDYSLTPELTLRGLVNSSWTDEKVDVDGLITGGTTPLGLTSQNRGDERYLGTEGVAGVTWKFAPNVNLDLVGAYLWTGDALTHRTTLDGIQKRNEPDDVYRVSTRIRYTF